MTLFVHIVSLSLYVTLQVSTLADVQCGICQNTATPGSCDTFSTCGADEICFTSEFVDHAGKQAFHLGCENRARCVLLQNSQNNASSDTSNDGSMTEDAASPCFNCCSTTNCNKLLCTNAVVHTTTKAPPVCPDFYLRYRQHCYFVGTWDASWFDGRNYCQKHGGHLASLNSYYEHQFLVTELSHLAAPLDSFWLGGFFSFAANQWEWADRTSVTYKGWNTGHPQAPANMTHRNDYYIILLKPVRSRSYWNATSSTDKRGFICENILPTH